MDFLTNTVYWAVLISLGSYMLGKFLQDKTKIILFNPLLFSTIFTVLFLMILRIDYDSY